MSGHTSQRLRCVGSWLSIINVLFAMILCNPARADEASNLTHLSWTAPAASGCIPARELERSVEALLGRKVFAGRSAASHELVGVVERHPGDWTVVLQLVGAKDNLRRLSAEDCPSLTRPLAIVIATLLDAWPDLEAPTRQGPTLALGLALDARSGVLPQLALGARVVGLVNALGWPVLRIQVGAWLPEREAQSGLGARFVAFQAGVALCPQLLSDGPLQLALCAGIDAGALQARAFGLASPRTPTRLLLSVPLEAALAMRVFKGASARIELGPAMGILRPSFYFDDAGKRPQVVHRVTAWGASARINLIVELQ
jgi:hypothetical protein